MFGFVSDVGFVRKGVALSRSGLIDKSVARLRAEITSGRWPVGTRIPAEPELMKLLGVGRNTAREAVQSLVHSGLLERRQGAGTFVTAASELTSVFGRHVAVVSQREVLQVRRSLELEIARLAATERTDADVVMVRELGDARHRAFTGDDVDAMTLTDLELHRAIAEASHNTMLIGLYDNLLDAISDNIRFNVSHDHGRDDHRGLVHAIVDGDPAAAMHEVETYLGALIDAIS